MLYMIVETYKNNSIDRVYERLNTHGRMLPDALHYVDSWVAANGARCYQLMSCDNM